MWTLVFGEIGQIAHRRAARCGPRTRAHPGSSHRSASLRHRRNGGPQAVLQTSGGFSAQGTNFARTMLRLGARRDRLQKVDNCALLSLAADGHAQPNRCVGLSGVMGELA